MASRFVAVRWVCALRSVGVRGLVVAIALLLIGGTGGRKAAALQTLPTLSISSPSVTEGAKDSTATLRFVVTLSAASTQTVEVLYSNANTGTASVNIDYNFFSLGTLRFAAGETTKDIDVTVRGDDLDEPNETVIVQMSSPFNATIATATGTGTITDDDPAPTVSLALDRTTISEGGAGFTWTRVRAIMTSRASTPTTITISASPGANTAATDYSLTANKTLTIPAGDTTSTGHVQLDAVDNDVDAPNKQVTLSGTVSNTIGGYANTADVTVTIQDNEATPKVTLALSASSINESGTTNSATVTATMTPASVQATTITVSAAAGLNAAAGDFTLSANKTLTIAAGDTTSSGSVTVTAVNNDRDENNKEVTVTATASNSQGVTNPDQLTLTILDDDAQPSISISSPSVTEGAKDSTTTMSFKVRLSARSGKQVTLSYIDARTGTATFQDDYEVFFGSVLRFAPGDSVKSIDVTVKGDDLDEPNETIVVSLRSPTNATIATPTGTGTITDDDSAPTVTLVLSLTSIYEGGTGFTFTNVRATQSAVSSAATTITVSAAAGTNAESGDFTLSTNKTLTIAAGQTSSTGDVRIDAVDNAVDDPDRQVTVSGTVANTLGGYSNPANVTLTIQDNEATPQVRLLLSASTIDESGSSNSATVTARMTPASVQATTITVSATAGADAEAADFSLSMNKTLTIAAGDTTSSGVVTVTAVNNDLDEPNKHVTVSATASNSQGATNPSNVTLTIADDDATPSLSISSPSVAESDDGETATLAFQVKLSPESGQRVSATYRNTHTGTATHSRDYELFSDGTLVFAPGDTLKTINVTVKGDSLDEANETVVVQLTRSTNATISTATGTGTITDDDPAPTVTLVLGLTTIREGAPGFTFTSVRATQSAVSSATTTITVSAAAGTNAESGDFTLSANKTLTIAAGQTRSTGDVRIDAVDNAVDDPDRQVTVSGTVANTIGGYSNPANVTLTIQDNEATPQVRLLLSASTIDESGTSNSATVTARMTPASVQATTITVSAAAGANAKAADFSVSSNKTLTIAAGDTTSTGVVTVTAVNNDLDEPNKSVTVSATASNSQGATNPSNVTLTIADDEASPSLSVSSPSVSEGDAGETATLAFQVKLSPESGQRVTVKARNAGTGTASLTADYDFFSDQLLTFAPGDTLKTVNVTVRGDSVDEVNETVVLQLLQPTNATIGTATGTGTITDDDATPTVTLVLGRAQIYEGGTGITWTNVRATLSGVSSASTTVTVSAAAGTNAESGDFTLSANKTLTIAAGQTSSTGLVRVDAVDNAVDDPNRQVIVSGAVTNTIGGYSNPANVTLTIQDDEATPQVRLLLSASTIDESGTSNSATITARMTPASVQATTITVSVSAGADAEAADFTASANKTLTIAAGDTTSTGVVTVTAVDNDLDEPNKHVTVSATASNSQGVTNPSNVTLTIRDNDATPSLTISSPSVAEGDDGETATLSFQVKLSPESGQRVSASYRDTRTGTATHTADYAIFSDGTLVFAPGDTLKTVNVTVKGDSLDEVNETVIVQLSNPTNATITTGTGTGTITDDDAAPTVTMTLGRTSIYEGGTGFTWTTVRATLSAVSSAATTVTVSAAPGTGAESGDFTLSANKTLTIAAGQTTSTGDVRVNAVDNAVDDPNRQVTVSGTVTNSIGGYSNPSDLTLTIQDDEATPKVRLLLSPSTIDESGTSNSSTVSARMTPASSQATTITVSAAAGAHAAAADFTVSANKTLTIAAGDTTSTGVVTVTAVDNDLDETNKSVTVSATASNSQGVTNPDNVMLTIADDEALPSLTISSPSVTEGDDGETSTLSFQVKLSPESGRRASVSYRDARTGTATHITDYAHLAASTLVFQPGDTLKTVDVTVKGDSLDEANETVVLQLSSPTNAAIATGTGTGTITDDDATPTVSLTLDLTSINEASPGFTWTVVRARLSAPSTATTTVTVSAAAGANAEAGDFTLSANKKLTIAAGQTTSTGVVRIDAVDNDVDDPNRQVTVSGTVTNAIGGYSNPSNVTLTIRDDEATPKVRLLLSPSTIDESGTSNSATVTARMTPASVQATTITVSVAAGADAEAGDFTVSANKTLSIAAGDTTSTGVVTVTAVDNDLDEPNKSVTVSATATNSRAATNPDNVTLTIRDDEATPSLTISSPSVAEGDDGETATLSFQVKLSPESGQRVSVSYRDTRTGTATHTADYAVFSSGTLVFAPGDTLKTVSVTVKGDSLDEANETVIVQLSSPTNATITTGTGTGTITDDDGTPTVTLVLGRAQIVEGGTGLTWTDVRATLSAVSGATTTVTVSATASTNAESGDFTLSTNKTLTIAAGQTSSTGDVRVNAVDNAVDDPNRQVTVSGTVTNSIGGYSNPTDVTLTIQDDEATPKVRLLLSRSTIDESGTSNSATVTARMTPASSQATAITVSAAAGTNAEAADFTVSANKTLTIAAGDTTSTGVVTVTAVDNALDDANKSVTVSATASNSHGATNPDNVTLTITDDDATPSLTISSPSVTEGDDGETATLSFQVKLSPESGRQVSVSYRDARTGTATQITDYVHLAAATLVFPPGDTLKTVDVTVKGDSLDEANETVVLQLSSPTNATISTGTGTGTITDDDATPTVSLTLDLTAINEASPGFTWTVVRARLSAPSTATTTVTVSAVAGANAEAGDFTLSANKTLTIAAGQTTSTGVVRIDAVDNDVDDPNRQVTVSGTVANTIGGYSNPSNVTLTIRDDEATPKVRLLLSPSTIDESGSSNSATITARMTPASVQATTITVSATAGADAVAGDFTLSANKTLSIAAGDTTSTGVVTVTAVDNDQDDPSKSVTVSATATNTQAVTNPDNATLTISDDDATPSLSISSPSVTEGAKDSTTTMTFWVRLSAQSGKQVSVRYGNAHTGTATNTVDYDVLSTGLLVFPAGDTLKSFDVTVNGDDLDEPNETVVVTLRQPVNATIATGTGTGTITDDEPAPTVTLEVRRSPIQEGGVGFTWTQLRAHLSARSSAPTTVTVSAAPGTNAVADDFTLSANKTLTIPAGDTVSGVNVRIDAVDNNVDDLNRQVTVSGTVANTIGGYANPADQTLTIQDDEAAPKVKLVLSASTIDESGTSSSATVTATMTPSIRATTITVSATAGTNAEAADFTVSANKTLTIAAGDSTSTGVVTVTAVNNSRDEPNKSVTVSATATNSHGITNPDDVTLTIEDDDAAPSISISSPSVTEGAKDSTTTMTFEVKLSAQSGKQVTVVYGNALTGTAALATDYTFVGGTLRFAPGDTLKEVDATVLGDDGDEPNETVVVRLRSPTNGTIATATGTGTIIDDDAPPTVSLVLARSTISEGGTGVTSTGVRARLHGWSSAATTITVSATPGTSADATDFTLSANKTLTIAANGATSTGVVTLTAVDNAVDDPDRQVTVSATVSNTLGGYANPANATVTIQDDEATPKARLLLSASTIDESGTGNAATVTARMSPPSAEATTITVSAAPGANAVAADFELSANKTLSIAAGDSTSTGAVTVTAVNNSLDEPNKQVTVSATALNSHGATDPDDVTLTIADDEGEPTLTISSPSVAEGAAGATTTLSFEVKLSSESRKQVTVAYVDAGTGTATSGADYVALSGGTLTFVPGDTLEMVNVTVNGDATDEVDETVLVTLSSATNASIGTATGTGTITDDDAEPSLTISSPSATEGATGTTTTLSFEVKLSTESGRQVTVAYADAGTGTATSGADYATLTGGTLTFAPGDTLKTVSVTVNGDNTEEPNETVLVTLSSATNATIGTATGTGTITDDDDGTVLPTLSARPASTTEGGAGTTTSLRFTVRLSPAATATATVRWSDSGEGTATSGADYEAATGGTLTFVAGDTIETISVTVLGDDEQEGNETIMLALTDPTSARLATPTVAGTIVDDDAPPPPSLHVDSPQVQEGDDGFSTMAYTVTLTPASTEEVRVDYAEAGTGTATPDNDYAALQPGTLVFAPGDTISTILVQVAGDNISEPDETVVIALSNAQGARLETFEATGTILDDEVSVLAVNAPRVKEGNAGVERNGDSPAVLVFEIALAPPNYREVTVAYADAGTGTATPGVDYRAPEPGTLTFAPGEALKTVEVTVLGDDLDEADETVALQLSRPTNAELEGDGTGTGTILDDDGPPTLSIDSVAVQEGGPGETTSMRFTVRLNKLTTKTVSVEYADAGAGTATAGDDYRPVTPGTLVFAPGDTATIVEITIQGDALDEPAETIALTLSNPANAELPNDGATGVGTILDDDDPPTLSIDSPTALEGDPGETAAISFMVSLSAPTAKQVTVEYADAGTGTATPGADYQAVSPAALVFAPGDTAKTVIVTIQGDALDEPAETIALTLSNPTNAELPEDGATGVGTILDDDEAPSLSVDSPTVVEGNEGRRPMTFSFTLDRPSGRRVVVEYSDAGTGTATSAMGTTTSATGSATQDADNGADYDFDYEAIPSGVVGFDPGETRATVDVIVIGDTRHEPDETVVLRISVRDTATATITEHEAVGTIENDDADLVPTFGDAQVPSQRWMEGRAIAPLALPPAQGGDGPLIYALAPDLPPGLTFDPERRTVTGTPGAGQPVTTYRYAATDQDGDSATLSFTIEVVAVQETARVLDEVNRAVLPEVARTWADAVSTAVAGRVAQAGQAGIGAGAWGHGEFRRVSGAPGQGSPVDWSGETTVVGAGADMGLGASMTLGVAVARLDGAFDYVHRGDERAHAGWHDTRLTGVHPYFGWSGGGGYRAWTTAGYATSDVVVHDDEAGQQNAAGNARMLAAGAAARLLAGRGGATLEAKADGHLARFRLDGNGDRLSSLEVGVHRLRLAFEARWPFRLGRGSGSVATPSAALGVRQDGGDGRTGTGLEAGGAVTFSAWNSRLQVEASGRTLLAHGGGLTEWGAGGSLRISPGADGRGLSLRLQPEWGAPRSGIGQVWRGHALHVRGPSQSPPHHPAPASRLDGEIAYGLDMTALGLGLALAAEALVTPYAALGPDPAGPGSAWRFGARLHTPPQIGLGLGLEAAHPSRGLRLELQFNR